MSEAAAHAHAVVSPVTSHTHVEPTSRGVHTWDNSQPGFPEYKRRIANPAPLGLLAFATTTWIVSLFLVQTRHVYVTNITLAMALSTGGLVQFLAGMWEFVCGNTYATTMFGMLGGFYLSVGAVYWPGSGITAAYEGVGDEIDAIGIYITAWFIFSVIMLIASLRTSVAMTTLWGSIFMTYMLVMIGTLHHQEKVLKAAGGFGILTSAVAFYCGAAGLWVKDASFFNLPVVPVGEKSTSAV